MTTEEIHKRSIQIAYRAIGSTDPSSTGGPDRRLVATSAYVLRKALGLLDNATLYMQHAEPCEFKAGGPYKLSNGCSCGLDGLLASIQELTTSRP